ncbi:MAG: enoyl-CoA hydratase-related protein [Saprospiraceae bacterium]
MKEFQTLAPEMRGQVLVLCLNRPDALNALNSMMFDELDSFFTSDYKEYNPASIIITGRGEKAFAAGADIKELHGLSSQQAEMLSRKGQLIFNKIEAFHLPVIGAINGFALGGGCELAMACHIRVASTKAKFGQPEVNLGIIPGYGGTQRLIQLIGKGKATELLLTGDMINADEAYRLGLVNYVTEPEQLIDRALELASRMMTRGPIALAGVIRTVNHYFSASHEGFVFEASTFGEIASSEDFAEGTAAFIEKRKPAFQGK